MVVAHRCIIEASIVQTIEAPRVKSALIILSCMFASRFPAPVPSGGATSIAIGWVSAWLHCAEGGGVDTFYTFLVHYVWFHIAFALCFALLLDAHLAWLVAWLSCLPCRNWWNIIIIILC
jgi:hypothetical protein